MKSKALLIVSLLLLPTIAFPVDTTVYFNCPSISTMYHSSNCLVGIGMRSIDSINTNIYFKNNNCQNILKNLDNYGNLGVDYNSETGEIICIYGDFGLSASNFDLTYIANDCIDGFIKNQTTDDIEIVMRR